MDAFDNDDNSFEDLYNTGEDAPTRQKYDPLPDFHLRNPLKCIKDELLAFDYGTTGISKRKRMWLAELKKFSSVLEAGDQISLMLNAYEWLSFIDDISDFSDIASMVMQRLEMDAPFSDLMKLDTLSNVFGKAMSEVDVGLLKLMRSTQQLVQVMNALSSRRPVPDRYEGNISGNIVIIACNRHKLMLTGSYIGICDLNSSGGLRAYVYDGDWLRGVADVYTQRLLLNISCEIGNNLNRYHYPSWDYVDRIINWGDRLLSIYGNNGFKMLKAYEALCAGYLMTLSDDLISDRHKFYKNTRYDLMEENITWREFLDDLDIILTSAETTHWISQVYGLHRVWGHPLIDSIKGMEKVILIGRKDIVRSESLPKIIAGHFNLMLTRGYRSRFKRMPLMSVDDSEDTLKTLIENNDPECVNPRSAKVYDWTKTHFERNFQLPETFNLSMIVADKSVSPTRMELIRNIKKRKTVMNSELRRGVLRWINDSTIDPREFLRDINNGLFPRDHMIIGLTPKERELNPTPRMFSLMSHLMRVYVVITEAMLSEHILPLFPQITMTDSLLDLSKKIYGNVKELKGNQDAFKKRAQRTVCYSLDFEKWNGHMRKSSTGPMFDSLGSLFGLPNLFSNTYDIFEGSYYYLADGSYVPRYVGDDLIPEEPKSFTGHKGGMEGLRQKGWTLFTVVCLDYILSKHNCQYQIMGMGDNQVLIVTFYTHHIDITGTISRKGIIDLKNKMNGLTSDLISTFGDLGLPLKPLETWTSESLFIYGKYPVWKGVPLSMDLKRLMRSFPFSNDDIMTVENMLNTVAGGATSATQNGPFIGVSYLIGLLMLCLTVNDLYIYHPLTGKGIGKMVNQKFRLHENKWSLYTKETGHQEYVLMKDAVSKDVVMMMMILIPRSLGGYVTFNWPTLLMRGFPDPLTRDLYVVKKMLSVYPTVRNGYLDALWNWSRIIYMPTRNIKLLLEDILSLNLLRPVTPIAEVRQSVSKFLSKSKKIKNDEFKDLMQVKNGELEDLMADVLCCGSTIHIRLVHDIYESTIVGYIDSIVSKVTKTATIQRLSMMNSKKDVSVGLINCEDNYLLFYIWRCSQHGDDWSSTCETEVAKHMRYMSWAKHLKGVTVPFPLSYMSPNFCYNSSGTSCACSMSDGYISNHISDNATEQKMWELELGDGQPYLGSITSEKVTVQTGSRVYSSEPLVKRPVQLLRTINWFVPPDSNCANIIKACLKAVTDVDPEQFVGVTEGTSGAEAHRYRDSSLSHGTLTMCNYLYSTRMHISTDNLLKYSRGGKNCDIHFQAIMCAITEITNIEINHLNRLGEGIPRVRHWHETCSLCVTEIDEDFIDIPSDDAAGLVPSRKENRYLFVEEGRISYIEDSRPYFNVISGYASPDTYNLLSDETKYNLLLDIVSDFIVEQITQKSYDIQMANTVSMHSGQMLNRLIYTKLCVKELFLAVAQKVSMVAEFRVYTKHTRGEQLLGTKIREIASNIVSEANIGSFLGLGLYYSWGPVIEMDKYSWFISPSTTPPTLTDACASMQKSLVSYIKNNQVSGCRRTQIQVEDSKDSGLAYKLIMIDKITKIKNHCQDCKIILASTPHHEYTKKTLILTCKRGHHTLERYKLKVRIIRCTMDRLRKDAIGRTVSPLWVTKPTLKPLPFTSVLEIMNSTKIRARFQNIDESYFQRIASKSILLPDKSFEYKREDIMKIVTQPTSASYKYYDILSFMRRHFLPQHTTWILGDGYGFTSDTFNRVIGHKVIISTIIDSEKIIPQTMPNLYQTWDDEAIIGKLAMVNKCNNIFHPRWEKDWSEVYTTCRNYISDIELLGPERASDRSNCLRKLMELQSWNLVLHKDYIYTRKELELRVSCLLKYTSKFSLITSSLRQKGHPEVWWVIRESSGVSYEDGGRSYVVYHESTMRDMWNKTCTIMSGSSDFMDPTVLHINKNLVDKPTYLKMLSRAFSWSYFQSVGYLIPLSHDFTHVLGRLQQGVKPEDVASASHNSALKLYKDKERELRDKLLIIATSMLSTVEERYSLFKQSHKWHLGWRSQNYSTNWCPYLYYDPDTRDYAPRISPDYIAVLSIFFGQKKLLFDSFGDEIRFDYSRKSRANLVYPVAKNMTLRLSLSEKSSEIRSELSNLKPSSSENKKPSRHNISDP